MNQICAMFPGQGSQYVGMGRAIWENFPYAKLVFEEAEDAAQLNIRKLCIDGPETELTLTANTQPCILAVSIATWRVLLEETGLKPDIFAGHSLGEYSALVASGRLELSRAAMLVRHRGLAMQEAVGEGLGAMAAVMRCPEPILQELCKKASRDGSLVSIANHNSPDQLVVAGHKPAVEKLGELVAAHEGTKFVLLKVSAPFHSSLMAPAKAKMLPLLEESVFEPQETLFLPNVSAELTSEYHASYLVDQIDHPVLWSQSIKTATEAQARSFIEVGPGKVLFSLARRMVDRKACTLQNSDDICNTVEKLKS